jgi:hypothetical protein
MTLLRLLLTFVLSIVAGWAPLVAHQKAARGGEESDHRRPVARADVLARAQVWRSTDIASMDMTLGPQGKGAFLPHAMVTCDYVDKKLSGATPKFACRLAEGDELKVKYGGTNGEVYGELLATRLLWALGFGADAMYSVNVICRKCPAEFGGIARPGKEMRFDPAVVERKMPGHEWHGGGVGWSWEELDRVDPDRGGAPLAQRDALKLLAVFLQHTDSKPEQQRILCLGDAGAAAECARPFLMISDLGLTFGSATHSNGGDDSSVNLQRWRAEPVWAESAMCIGNLRKSFTGTLKMPAISEAGRAFLAGLLTQLTDAQLRALFEAARVDLRLRSPGRALSGFASVDEWTTAFKAKRDEIVNRRCA